MNCMRHIASVLLLAVAAASAPMAGWPQPMQGHDVATITIRLSNFAYSPEHVDLRAGVPVRLHLVNDSDLGHDFSAKGFLPPRCGKWIWGFSAEAAIPI